MNTKLKSNPQLDESVEIADYRDTVVLTSTMYDDSKTGIARSLAARDFITNSAREGIRLVMCDGGSGDDFLKYAKSFSNVTVLEYHDNPELQKSHFPRRQHGMGYILQKFPDAQYIYWTEPEKAGVITRENLSRVLTPLRDGSAEQVIPTPKPHDNRPAYMRQIEMRAMRRAEDIIKNGGSFTNIQEFKAQYPDPYGESSVGEAIVDHWFGPRAFNRDIAEKYFMKSNRKIWDGIILPSAKAQHERGTTLGVSVDFDYAPQQLADESDPSQIPGFIAKRKRQYRTLIRAFLEDFNK